MMLIILDIILFNIAIYSSLFIRFDGKVPIFYLNIFLHSFLILTFINIIIYYAFGLYRSLWRYASISELIKIFFATLSGIGAIIVFGSILNMKYPRSVYIILWLLTFLMLGTGRLSYRIIRRMKWCMESSAEGMRRIMVIGAGEAGSMVIKEMKNHVELKSVPVVVVDDDKWKLYSSINGIPIKGNRFKIKELAEKYMIDEIIIAIPSAKKSEISEILNICKQTKCKLKTLPGVYEILNEKVSVKHLRDVCIEDLLGRDEVKLNNEEIAGYLKNEVVLVTGGGGSIGAELCRQIAKFNPRKLVIFDIYENNAYDLQNELLHTYKNKLNLEILIGSVRDKKRLAQVFSIYRPGVVFHAAAHKHVPLMENNPSEAIKNNVFGTLNTAQFAHEYGVKKFVLISTDKAVNPTNIMGATKRLAEMIIQAMDKHCRTEFVAVRFGNVLGSNGSVIPLFKKQIAHEGPVTVTHPDIIRYFMTIPEAAQLVIQAGAMAKGGEIFILDMGDPVKIADLARDLIRLSGLEPDVDIKIEFTGLRPGEKLYEELLLEEEGIKQTLHEKIFIGQPLDLSYQEVLLRIKALENSMDNPASVRECMSRIVPTYVSTYGHKAAAQNS
ncbi:MAG: polysaccharide biosynthesis protein [Deltaproteobacteria bacterium]